SAELKIPQPQLASPLHALCERGIAEKNANGELELTSTGAAMRDRIVAARRKGLADMLARWRPEEHPDVLALIERMAQALASDLPAPNGAEHRPRKSECFGRSPAPLQRKPLRPTPPPPRAPQRAAACAGLRDLAVRNAGARSPRAP